MPGLRAASEPTRTRTEWTALIEEQIASGKQPTEWANENRIDPQQLGWWRWKLGYSRGSRGRTATPPVVAPRLLPVTVREEPRVPETLEVLVPAAGAIVRVPRGFDAEHLARVVAALGDAR